VRVAPKKARAKLASFNGQTSTATRSLEVWVPWSSLEGKRCGEQRDDGSQVHR
jgi:hypothetical protein